MSLSPGQRGPQEVRRGESISELPATQKDGNMDFSGSL